MMVFHEYRGRMYAVSLSGCGMLLICATVVPKTGGGFLSFWFRADEQLANMVNMASVGQFDPTPQDQMHAAKLVSPMTLRVIRLVTKPG